MQRKFEIGKNTSMASMSERVITKIVRKLFTIEKLYKALLLDVHRDCKRKPTNLILEKYN